MLLMLAVVCSSFGFAMQPVAQRTISSETTGLMTAINPLTTAVLGSLILHEPFGLSSFIGAALILIAIILHNLRHLPAE
jgi:drug/metabolite transporter (DMT)-like permease